MEKKIIDVLLRETFALTREPMELPPLPAETEKPKIVLIGQPQQNLFGVLNKIFGGLDDLESMMFRSFNCTFAYGEDKKIFVDVDDTLTETTAESLMQMLLVMDDTKSALRCKIELNCLLLKKICLSIAASGYDYEDFDAFEILSAHDFYLFTLTATALFSGSERTFLNEVLLPNATDVTGFIVTNANLILEKDQGDIDDKLKNLLPEDTPIFFVPDADEKKIADELELRAENLQDLHDRRKARVEKILLNKALSEVNIQIEALTLNSENLDGIIARLSAKSKELPKRQESIFRRARTTYILKIQMDAVERVTAFNQQILDKIRDEVQQGKDVNEMREILPNYIRDMWRNEMDSVQSDICDSLKRLQNNLESMIEKNLREFLNSDEATQNIDFDLAVAMTNSYDGSVGHYDRPNEFNADVTEFKPTEVEEGSQLKRYGVIAAGVALALTSHPIVGAAIAIFGSRSIKQKQETAFLAESKEAMLKAAKDMTSDLYNEACRWIKDGLDKIEQNLSDCIAACCQNIMDSLITALKDKKQSSDDYAQQLEKLKDIKQQLEEALYGSDKGGTHNGFCSIGDQAED